MGQGLDVRSGDRQHRVPEPSELDPLTLGDELELGGRCVQRAGLGLRDRELRLGVTAEDPLAKYTLGGLVREFHRICAMRLHRDDRDVLPGDHASETQAGLEILKLGHVVKVDRIGSF